MLFAPIPIKASAKGLSNALPNRTHILVPHLNPEKWWHFYQWARSYHTGDIQRPRAPYHVISRGCAQCNDSGYVLDAKRQLRPCPRWSRQFGCVG